MGGHCVLSYVTIPYKKIQIRAQGDAPSKIIYAPILKISLFYKNYEHFDFDCVVDSGADFCVFPANLGELAGLDVFGGKDVATYGIGGKETLYFHNVKVEAIIKDEPWVFECHAGFSTKLNSKGIGFLGRDGFFDLFQEVSFNQKAKMFRLKEF
jgi:hypothetical protein